MGERFLRPRYPGVQLVPVAHVQLAVSQGTVGTIHR
jgi:hypothetical protein